MATSFKIKTLAQTSGREQTHAVPPDLCPDLNDLLTYLMGLITGPAVSLIVRVDKMSAPTVGGHARGWFSAACPSRFSIIDLLSLLAWLVLTRPGQGVFYGAGIICLFIYLSSAYVA